MIRRIFPEKLLGTPIIFPALESFCFKNPKGQLSWERKNLSNDYEDDFSNMPLLNIKSASGYSSTFICGLKK